MKLVGLAVLLGCVAAAPAPNAWLGQLAQYPSYPFGSPYGFSPFEFPFGQFPFGQPAPAQPATQQPKPAQPSPYSNYGQYPSYGMYPYGYGQYSNPYGRFPFGQVQNQKQNQEKYIWLCLEDIFPKHVRDQAGLPEDLGETLSSIATHAFVLYGTSPSDSIAWQVQLNEGQQYWAKVLMDSKKIDRAHPVEWGRQYAATITGSTKITSLSGASLYANSKKCFRSSEPSKCTNDQLRSFSSDYLKAHPRFNLANENCVLYACSVFDHCAGGCDVKACQQNLSFEPMTSKDPKCNTVPAKEFKAATNALGINAVLNEKWSDDLKDFLPMHDPHAIDVVKALMAAEAQQPTAGTGDLAHAA